MYNHRFGRFVLEGIYVFIMVAIFALTLFGKLHFEHFFAIFLFNVLSIQLLWMSETKIETPLLLNFQVVSLILSFVLLIYFQDVDDYFAHMLLIIANLLIFVNWHSILDNKKYQAHKVLIWTGLCLSFLIGSVLFFFGERILEIYLAVSVLVMMLLPIGHVLVNYKRIINYMEYKKNILIFLTMLWIVFVVVYYKLGVMDGTYSPLNLFIIFSMIHYSVQNLFLTYYSNIKELVKESFVWLTIAAIILLIGRFYLIGLVMLFGLNGYVFTKMNHYFGLVHQQISKHEFQRRVEQLKNESQFQSEIANDFHDSVLQDIIYLKKKFDAENVPHQEASEMLSQIILSIREKMATLSPKMYLDKTFSENISLTIEEIQNRYQENPVLLDIFCDERLYLESPYDEIVLRIVKELVNNIYKHSQSTFAEIRIIKEENEVHIEAYNDEGTLDEKALYNNRVFSGLAQIYRIVDLLNGEFLIPQDDGVRIIIRIPIEGGIVIEHSINRRS
ncbi:sensor histidine kinase [Streptococcus ovis]|uniref:sensor histidine kinase n=1 Tax=Streptococcus ovis TaxID=82806 RepID=UPI000362BD1E|nr:ATP-binding protein [Streptococcus ovis]